MRRFWGAFLLAGLVISSSAWAGDEKSAGVPYTGRGARDPFVDPADIVMPVDEAAAMQSSLESMTVQGVLYAQENPVAIIDGKIYRVGSRIGSGQVVRIEKEGVTIAQSGQMFTIKQSRGKANAA